MKAEQIPVDSIRVLLSRAREKVGWEQLRDSMADPQYGLVAPVGVRELERPEGKVRYELLYGEGRLEAAKDLNWKTIPAIVKRANNAEAVGLFLSENLIRRPQPWAEKGRVIREEMASGATIEEVAKLLHISVPLAQKYHRTVNRLAQGVEAEAMALPINDAESLATVPAHGQRMVIELAAERGERVGEIAKAAVKAMPPDAGWTKAGLQTALRSARDGATKLSARLKVLRLHHALGPGNVRTLLQSDSFRAAAKKAGVNLTKFHP